MNPSANRPDPDDSSARDEAWLDAALRDTAREHLDDAGFTARVTGALPAPATPARRGLRRWRRSLLLLGAMTLGAGLAAAFGGPGVAVALDRVGGLLDAGWREFGALDPWVHYAVPYGVAAVFLGFSGWWSLRRT